MSASSSGFRYELHVTMAPIVARCVSQAAAVSSVWPSKCGPSLSPYSG
jgi:hypothetical protein